MKMRKKLFTALLSLCFLVMYSCSMEPSVPKGEFLIQGRLLNVPDSTVVSLSTFDGKLFIQIAQDTLIGGEFMFRDTITTGIQRLCLMVRSEGFPNTWLGLWVDSGELIKVTGDDNLIKTWNVESDVPEQKEENSFVQASFPERIEKLKLSIEETALIRNMYSSETSREFQIKCWAKIDSLRKLSEPIDKIITQKELFYLKEVPVTKMWMHQYLFYASRLQYDRIYSYNSEIKDLYARMSDSDKQTELGKEITSYMNLPEKLNVGDDMVDGDLYDLEGKVRHLSEFKGKYIMLDFWSMGCGPCIQSIPELDEISEMYKDKLAVISISMDSKKMWQEYIANEKLTGFQWNELRKGRTGLAASYKVKGIPHYVLISPDGKVQDIWSGYGTGSLKTKLKNLQ